MRVLQNWRAEVLWAVAIAFVATMGLSQNVRAQFSCDDQPLYDYESAINLCLAPGYTCYSCEFKL